MAFFRNTTVNLLNLHYGLHALALSGGGAFYAVFLLKAGVPAPGVLLAIAAILLGRACVRPLVLPLATRFGLRRLLIAGTVLTAVQYPLLAEVTGVGPSLYLLCVASSLGDTLYWTCYHAYFAVVGDAAHRGQQIGAREAMAAVVGVIAPLVTGWALVAFGPLVAFGAAGAVLMLAALPLLATPDAPVHGEDRLDLRQAWPAVAMFAADSWAFSCYGLAWDIVLFTVLGRSFTAFGAAMAVAALAGAVASLLLGRVIDAGRGRKAVVASVGALALCIVVRAFGYGSPAVAVIANAFAALVAALHIPTVMTAVYNMAQRSACPLRFHIACEAGWDLGGGGALLLSAAFLQLGARPWSIILLALLGAAAMFGLLWRAYAPGMQRAQLGSPP